MLCAGLEVAAVGGRVCKGRFCGSRCLQSGFEDLCETGNGDVEGVASGD
jgi:hypothetical protein